MVGVKVRTKPQVKAAAKPVLFELRGPGLSPDTVDTLVLLRLAEAFFALTAKVAESRQLPLTFHGLQVLPKCVAVAAVPSDQQSARLVAPVTLHVVAGTEDPPHGADGIVVELRQELRALAPKQSASFGVAKHLGLVKLPKIPAVESTWERLELRVRPVRVGGLTDPTAVLASPSETGTVTVKTGTRDIAKTLGACLYRDVDVVLEIRRDINGFIERGGKVLEVHPVENASPVQAWRDWFAEQGEDWDRVKDVAGELGRFN